MTKARKEKPPGLIGKYTPRRNALRVVAESDASDYSK
jgi:hypothetical protein